MKFIIVNDNVSVRKNEIISVERLENGNAKVVLNNFGYESNYPYGTFLQLLEIQNIEEKVSEQMTLPMAYQQPQQYWAG